VTADHEHAGHERLDGFEGRLIAALQPIRHMALGIAIHHLFDTGLFDALAEAASSAAALAACRAFDPVKLEALLKYLRNEGIVTERGGVYRLSAEGRALAEFRGWYTMFVGGYAESFLQLGDRLRAGAGPATRNAAQVGIGSCAISHYDAIPLTRRLMSRAGTAGRRLLDLGCGNARYLVEFCAAVPEIEALGVEPDPAGYAAARDHVRAAGLDHRIRLACASATEFMAGTDPFEPDFLVLGFVLHEILGQSGVAGVEDFIQRTIRRFPDVHLIVIEVDDRIDRPASMGHGLALAYYNPYYLLHPFTQQRLESVQFWRELFGRVGLTILDEASVDPRVDSTELEVGFLLRRART
jgi:2-ketoarginine methyltransferase